MACLLALDTATEACSVALWHQGEILGQHAVIPRLHAQRILPMIQQLLLEADLRLADVQALAFGRGPGAFTGLRIAAGVTQGLAFALQVPVIPVSNLTAVAQRAHREYGVSEVIVAMDARMNEVYSGYCVLDGGVMGAQQVERVGAPEQISWDASRPAPVGVGTAWSAYAERMPPAITCLDAGLLPDARDILALALPAWRSGAVTDADGAVPVYLRDKVAVPKGGFAQPVV